MLTLSNLTKIPIIPMNAVLEIIIYFYVKETTKFSMCRTLGLRLQKQGKPSLSSISPAVKL